MSISSDVIKNIIKPYLFLSDKEYQDRQEKYFIKYFTSLKDVTVTKHKKGYLKTSNIFGKNTYGNHRHISFNFIRKKVKDITIRVIGLYTDEGKPYEIDIKNYKFPKDIYRELLIRMWSI